MQVKNVFYHPNGTGRDRYIFSNSGGFMKVKKIFNQNITSGQFIGKEEKKFEGVKPKLKRVTYNPDGSGRDIYANDGQILVGNYKETKQNFLKSLRDYDIKPLKMNENNLRINSASPLKTSRFLVREREIRDFNPQYKIVDDNNSPKYKVRKIKYKQIINFFDKRMETTFHFTKENKPLNSIELPSTMKAAQYPNGEKIILRSPKRYQNQINPMSQISPQPNTIQQIQKMLNCRKII